MVLLGKRGEGKRPCFHLEDSHGTEDPNLQLWMSLALSSVQRRGEGGLGGSLQLVMLGELEGGEVGCEFGEDLQQADAHDLVENC